METSSNKPYRYLILPLLFGSMLGILTMGCLPKESVPGEEGVGQKDKRYVLAVMATAREIPLIHRSMGEIVPTNRIRIHADKNATISKVLVHEGQKINAGTTLLNYDTELEKEKLELVLAEAEEAEAAVDYDQFRFDNREDLLEDEEISQNVYDYIEKKLEYEKTRIKRARAEAEYLRKVVTKSDVVSSIGGVVMSRSVADQLPVVEGQFLMEIVQADPVKLKIRLPEEFIPATHRGQLLQVRYPNGLDEQTVKISDVGVSVDSLTRTFEVMATLENPDGLLKAGMELATTLVTEKKTRTISIPKSSVALRDKRTVVFRIIEGVAKKTPVRLGQTFGTEVAVLKGVKDGDILVLDPPKDLKNGNKVEIQTAATQAAQ